MPEWRRHPRRRAWAYRVLGPLLTLLVLAAARVRVAGVGNLPRRGPVLLAANHVSDLDPAVLAVVCWRLGRRVRFLTASEVFAHPIAGPVLRASGMIPVDRRRGKARLLRDALPALRAGEAVLVYPEGRIARPGQTLRARPGAGLLALRSGVPVVPLATWGLESLRSDGLPRRRVRAGVVIGAPLDLSRWHGDDGQAAAQGAADAMLAAIRALLPRAARVARS